VQPWRNWLKHNLLERLKDPLVAFHCTLEPQAYVEKTFIQAAEDRAREIAAKHDKIYLTFSGGSDSTFLVLLFKRLGIQVTPILVLAGNNTSESTHAIRLTRQHGLNTRTYRCTAEQWVQFYKTTIHATLNGIGINSVPALMLSRVADAENAVLVTADHIGVHDGIVRINEQDLYGDCFAPETIIPFFLDYSLTVALLQVIKYNYHAEKCAMYGLPERPKVRSAFNASVRAEIERINALTPRPGGRRHYFGTRDEVLGMLTSTTRRQYSAQHYH
jgi:hypothetical protein